MTMQDFLFLLLWMIQDFWVVHISFIQSVCALHVFTFSSFLDIHRTAALTGQPNYQTAQVPVFTTLNIAMWRELLSGYPDKIICEFLEFGWPIGYMSDTLPIFDLRTHWGALDFPD